MPLLKLKAMGTESNKIPKRADASGITLNGEMIYNDAVEELKNLDEQLRTTWETPPLDMIG